MKATSSLAAASNVGQGLSIRSIKIGEATSVPDRRIVTLDGNCSPQAA
jgi:hypothetical protein